MSLLDNFQNTTVAVIGDVMLDRYWWGSVNRISPEAPVPVVKIERMTLAAGGAANVAANIAAYGAACRLVGVIGDDDAGTQTREVLRSAGVSDSDLVVSTGRPSTVKTRLVAHSQQVARIDQEDESRCSHQVEAEILDRISSAVEAADVVVLSDYAKGVLSEKAIAFAVSAAKAAGIKVLVDPKGKDYEKYAGASLLTPNRREAAEAVNLYEHAEGLVQTAGKRLLESIDVDALLITEGSDGMSLFRRDGASVHLPALARAVFDVTGAGDTVIATLATALGSGLELETAAKLANIAAGLVVERSGTTTLTLAELKQHLNDTSWA
ncbi:MAG: D-heptose-7- phosphate 1-kinase,D-heptose-1-phosphate adenylyltransferase [Acidobacteria bacterium OLB17]|nr:MAG: D-heptose-7- phosphate 1-kinase,D-heptose-1-phosphate adenylyltransferase [Acidobacteria bacterium OLB17]MCZ2392199.1 D-glycero-beta-D-manno-heptose-7-phosphate kinase [Acidobacteriota bacterium]